MKKLSRQQETALLKKYIAGRFGVKTSIKKDFYSGGSSLRIEYAMGCEPSKIEAFVKGLQHGEFDGMTDSYNMKDEYGVVIEDIQLETFKYVFVTRNVPEELRYDMALAMSKKLYMADIHPCNNRYDYTRSFGHNIAGAWNWGQIAYQNVNKLNFVTQTNVKIVEAFLPPKAIHFLSGYHFVYEVDGKQYKTDMDGKNI